MGTGQVCSDPSVPIIHFGSPPPPSHLVDERGVRLSPDTPDAGGCRAMSDR
jgi:hypothetical protein